MKVSGRKGRGCQGRRPSPHNLQVTPGALAIRGGSRTTSVDESDDRGLTALGFAAVYIVALAARALLTSAPPYGDEAVHYAVARHLWHDDSKVHYIGDAVSEDYSVF